MQAAVSQPEEGAYENLRNVAKQPVGQTQVVPVPAPPTAPKKVVITGQGDYANVKVETTTTKTPPSVAPKPSKVPPAVPPKPAAASDAGLASSDGDEPVLRTGGRNKAEKADRNRQHRQGVVVDNVQGLHADFREVVVQVGTDKTTREAAKIWLANIRVIPPNM